jgi:hypothetical protein
MVYPSRQVNRFPSFSSNSPMIFNRVVFPQPEGPMMTTNPVSLKWRLTSSIAIFDVAPSRNILVMCVNLINKNSYQLVESISVFGEVGRFQSRVDPLLNKSGVISPQAAAWQDIDVGPHPAFTPPPPPHDFEERAMGFARMGRFISTCPQVVFNRVTKMVRPAS